MGQEIEVCDESSNSISSESAKHKGIDIIGGGEVHIYNNYAFLEQKKTILDQIQNTLSSEKVENLQELIEQLPEGGIKEKLTQELDVLRAESSRYQKERQELDSQIKLEQQRLDGLERKSKIWLSFLQRESAASIVGAVVLLLLTFSLIIGMVFGWESQVLSNGFLVILGYFFGQSSSRNNKDNDAGGNM